MGNQKVCATCFILIFSLSWWSEAKPVIPKKYTCNDEEDAVNIHILTYIS